jgi:REP element-mobilizing transposase RayT
MGIWNDSDEPLAYLITFRTYGTWLPGDERGSIDRYHNVYVGPRAAPNPVMEEQNRKRLKSTPVILSKQQIDAVDAAIREVCRHRNWALQAINVRTNHAHAVAAIGPIKPHRALNAFKAYGTRKMRETGCWRFEHSPWAEGGSKRWLWTEEHVQNACDYVIHGQGNDLRDFDEWRK